MDHQPLQDVGVTAEVHAPHPAGFVEMRKRPFQPLVAKRQQALAAGAPNATPIAVHGVASFGVLFPVPPSPIRFGDVAPDADGSDWLL